MYYRSKITKFLLGYSQLDFWKNIWAGHSSPRKLVAFSRSYIPKRVAAPPIFLYTKNYLYLEQRVFYILNL